ncbi:MAG: DUF192 domain-containing protein [Acidobacteria bacterium]|nr:DUF192 domain-containing protein [Acidobacteriota bacterium]
MPGPRRKGLLGRDHLEAGEGLWIVPTQAIHTFGMRFPIDAAFLDRQRRVKRVYHRLQPNRITRFVWGAYSVLELESGALLKAGTRVGDELEMREFVKL